MKTTLRAATVTIVVALVSLPGAAFAAAPAHPVQLEIGDSWTFGDGATDPRSDGYAGQAYVANLSDLDCTPAQADEAVDGCRHLERRILARPGTSQHPGVTTDLLIDEQLGAATGLLGERNGGANPHDDVEVVLVSVGGNDVTGAVLAACLGGLDGNCVKVIRERVAHVEANLDRILDDLRRAAGPDTSIVILTYDNAIAACPLASSPGAVALGNLVLEGNPDFGIVGLNTVIRSRAASYGVAVADTFGHLGPDQWVGDCLHPNDLGYATIAGIVREAIGR